MTDYRKNFLVLLLFAAVIMFSNLYVREIFSGDETRVAGIIAEMALDGNMVTSKLNGRPFLEYPPLYYQLGSFFFHLFGFTDAAAKLPSAVAAFFSALVVFALGKRLKFSADACLGAGVILLTGAQFFNNGRKCMVDMLLAFFVLLAIYSFYSLIREKSRIRCAGFFLLYSAGLAGGFFTKGLIGFAFPWAGLGIWLVAEDVFFRKKFSFFRYAALGLGFIPALIPIVYWAHRLYLEGGDKALHTVFMVNGIGRFSGSQGDHVESVWYYFEKLPGLFQPWLIFFLAGFAFAVYLFRKKKLDMNMLLPLSCSAAPLLMLFCSSAKRQVYLLPIYSAWALVTAWFLIEQREFIFAQLAKLRFPVMKYIRILLICIGFLQLSVFVFLVPGLSKLWFVAAIVLLFLGLRLRSWRVCLLLTALAVCWTGIDAGYLAAKNKRESLRSLFAACREAELKNYRITLNYSVPERTSGAAVFYMKKHLPHAQKGAPVAADEKRIIRDRNSSDGESFADHHRLLSAR